MIEWEQHHLNQSIKKRQDGNKVDTIQVSPSSGRLPKTVVTITKALNQLQHQLKKAISVPSLPGTLSATIKIVCQHGLIGKWYLRRPDPWEPCGFHQSL
jgi:hypothetical protein